MHFSKLRLTGFKSFVDPTELTILDGLTGVVGPNGCGKSNLLEALRWVLGETRASAMRGSGMDDVIFTGTASRHPKNFAEVVISIDNSERRAPAGFNEFELLEVSRRITRDIGSAYKINSKDVRAKDVQMLFADASTGAQSPALVRQGQIAELINAKPKNRRRILEEAAGISGLYQRRHEAELKLKAADTNLTRVDDVLDQLAQQINALQRQARHAARYREIGEDLRREEARLAYVIWHMASEQKGALSEHLKEARIAVTRTERSAREAQQKREEAEATLLPAQEEDALAGAILQRATLEREGLRKDAERAQSRVRGLQTAINQLDLDMQREHGLNEDAERTTAALEKERNALSAEHQGHDEAVSAAHDAFEASKAALLEAERTVQVKTEDVAALAARHQSLEESLRDVKRALETVQSQQQNAKASEAQAHDEAAKAQKAQEEAHATVGDLTRARDAAEKETEALETALEAAQNTAQSATQEKVARETSLRAVESELQTLERLLGQFSARQDAILAQVKVQPGYEKALGAALGDELQKPMSEAGTGWRLFSQKAQGPLMEGAEPLTDFVNAPNVLGPRLAHVFVAERRPAHLPVGVRVVSPAGDLWRWDGYCQLADDITSETARRLETLNRIDALGRERSNLETQLQILCDAQGDAQKAVEESRNALKAAKEALRNAENAMTEAERTGARAQNAFEAAGSKLQSAQAQQERLSAEEAGLLERQENATRSLSTLDDVSRLRSALDKAQQALDLSRANAMSRRAEFETLQAQGQARQSRMVQIDADLASWQERLNSAGQRRGELVSRKDETQRRLRDAQAAPSEIEIQITDLETRIKQSEKRRDLARDALAEAQARQREFVSSEREAQTEASSAREALARIDAQFEAAAEAEANALNALQERYEATPLALAESYEISMDDMLSKPQIEANVQKFMRQRDALGAVNLRADEDMKEVAQEHETLSSEKADLEEAIATLRSGIANLNKEGRERLRTAFEQVNTNFAKLFTHLFGGGEARLVMVESDDPLEAGLEIMCQPPGKKLSTLSLLSGGEQTLTALALIFAVFLANPAPICVLDEVDAPLDDANVTRFCDMLDEMCRQTETRFLIITHHALTMARMDRLFGVTMQEKGVSQLVSVDLRKAEEMVL